ncbi:DUF4232 domain-containing protein [Streptomyces hundungensis]|uniref:DUF4232 domain-containing protein n=1 Tax=Streptomyces hundungensis TaxID=1077946 RepID=UPI00340D767C
MKHTRIAALATIGMAAALSLTACGGDDSAQGAPATASSHPSSSSSNGDSKPEDGSGTGGSDAGSGNSGTGKNTKAPAGSTNGQGKSDGKTPFCKTADLAIDARNAATDKDSGRVDITMINRGSTTCSATGFAGVDIKDADHTSNPIERGPAQPRITTLKPGDAAVFDLAYTLDRTGKSLTHPTNILVTPPNETHSVTLKWPVGAGQIKGAYTDVQVYPTHTTN